MRRNPGEYRRKTAETEDDRLRNTEMTVSSKPVRGMRSIRTLGSKADSNTTPYKAYMRLFTLELEKSRRQQERKSAAQRVQNIDTRFREIEVEEAELLAVAGACRAAPVGSTAAPTGNAGTAASRAEPARQKKIPGSASGAFKVRY